MIEINDSSAALERDPASTVSDGSKENPSGTEGDVNSTAPGPPPPRKAEIPDPEVAALPKRRRFSADYKARIVEEAEGCAESGAIGALLRREGLFSSHLSEWRKLYRAGALQALRDDKRGRKTVKHPLEDEVAQLRKQNERLAMRLERAETIIEIQKKVGAMLGIPLNSVANEDMK